MVRLSDIRQQKMNSANDVEAVSGELWCFSLAFYELPGIASALLELQDSAGLNVDLILFAIWLGLSGRGRLDAESSERAERAIRPIQREVIEPLRALRRRLKAVGDDDVQRLRETIKELEIEAERVSLSRLAGLAGPVVQSDAGLCLADAGANLCLILGSAPCAAWPAAIIRRELQRFARNRSPGPERPRPARPIV
jgi:uncharacterized protein (TIGR02444 family)